VTLDALDLREFDDLADGARVFAEAFARGCTPPPPITVSQWADANRKLTTKSSALDGDWITDRTPYLREIMDALSVESRVRDVAIMKATQVGGTEIALNWLGYIIDHAPAPVLWMLPTLKLAKRNSKQRLAPMIEASPALRAKVPSARARDSGNTTLEKDFPGGLLVIVGAESTSDMRSMPAKFVVLDEVDEYDSEVGDDGKKQGSPIELAAARTTTFTRRKLVAISSPTVEGASTIADAFEAGDQRHYHVPCPHCAHEQALVVEQLTDDGHYLCIACGTLIAEHHKTAMLAAGRWVAKFPQRAKRSYHISGLYSPLGLGLTWREIADKRAAARTNPELEVTFVNTVLGLPHRGSTTRVTGKELREGREQWKRRTIPRGGLVLTVGIDVQHNRFEVLVVAWGRGDQCWFVDWVQIAGDPTRADDWAELDDYLDKLVIPNSCGVPMRPELFGIDSGNWSHDVYTWARKNQHRGVIALKGTGEPTAPVLGRPSAKDVNAKGRTVKRGVNLWLVGTHAAKQKLIGLLAGDVGAEDPDARRCHAPADMPDDFFDQLTAEVFDTRRKRWVKLKSARNEALDCLVYAYAAACHPRVRLHVKREHDWAALEAKLEPERDLFAAAPPRETHTAADPAPVPGGKPAPAPAATSQPGRAVGLGREGWNLGTRD
jgi:phage terminase large subunit GpA-like protein